MINDHEKIFYYTYNQVPFKLENLTDKQKTYSANTSSILTVINENNKKKIIINNTDCHSYAQLCNTPIYKKIYNDNIILNKDKILYSSNIELNEYQNINTFLQYGLKPPQFVSLLSYGLTRIKSINDNNFLNNITLSFLLYDQNSNIKNILIDISSFCFFKTTIDLNQYIFINLKDIKNKILDYIKNNPIYQYSKLSNKYYINFHETTLHDSNIKLKFVMFKKYELKFIFTLNNGNSPYSFLPSEFESFYKKYVKNNKMKYEIEYI